MSVHAPQIGTFFTSTDDESLQSPILWASEHLSFHWPHYFPQWEWKVLITLQETITTSQGWAYRMVEWLSRTKKTPQLQSARSSPCSEFRRRSDSSWGQERILVGRSTASPHRALQRSNPQSTPRRSGSHGSSGSADRLQHPASWSPYPLSKWSSQPREWGESPASAGGWAAPCPWSHKCLPGNGAAHPAAHAGPGS